MTVSRRSEVEGAWQYEDATEHEFAFSLAFEGIDLPTFDAFLERPDIWRSKIGAQSRSELLELRERALRAYTSQQLPMAILTARLMVCEARHIGLQIAVKPVVLAERPRREGLRKARRTSAENRRKKVTLTQYRAARAAAYRGGAGGFRKRLASNLKVAATTLRAIERRLGIRTAEH
jgi:hypothetical protein